MSVAPKKELGQHFLVDENLGVIGRLAELSPDDVVLEIGAGLGVLTRYLAEHAGRLHAVELDRSLEPQLRERLSGAENVELHFGDAVQLDLAALPRSWSRTFPTASRRRSSPRASTGCRRWGRGA